MREFIWATCACVWIIWCYKINNLKETDCRTSHKSFSWEMWIVHVLSSKSETWDWREAHNTTQWIFPFSKWVSIMLSFISLVRSPILTRFSRFHTLARWWRWFFQYFFFGSNNRTTRMRDGIVGGNERVIFHVNVFVINFLPVNLLECERFSTNLFRMTFLFSLPAVKLQEISFWKSQLLLWLLMSYALLPRYHLHPTHDNRKFMRISLKLQRIQLVVGWFWQNKVSVN